jgi:peptidoglycan hydrolase CwlO-like protein
LKDQLNQSDAERRHFEQQATTYKLQIDDLRRQFDDTANERDRSKNELQTSNYERTNMEKIRLVSHHILSFPSNFSLSLFPLDTQFSN